MRKHQREKLLFRYSSALARGDFATVSAILAEAERDPALARQLAELDAEYALEPVPTFSLNGHRRETTVSVYVNSAPKPRAQRFNLAFVSAAAVLVVTLLGTFLFANRPTGDDDVNAILPAAQSTETPTAAPTLVPTSTPLPATALPPTPTLFLATVVPPANSDLNATLDLFLPLPGSDTLPLICTGRTPDVIIDVRSLPDLGSGVVVGFLANQTSVAVVDSYQGDTEGWYYVISDLETGVRVQGWLPANAITPETDCTYAYSEDAGVAQVTYIIQPGDTLLSIAVQFDLDVADLPRLIELNNLGDGRALPAPGATLIIEVPSNRPPQMRAEPITSTPLPTVPPLDPMAATATQVIIDATSTAEGLLPLMATATQIIINATQTAESALSVTATATPIGQ
ncbi:MAG: LysM peptidoglycan-binding domain-containing protein [Chloroflexi bacterium]|nr:LysM peptidoglycan-binding domain-containing protein [Chloroflexota bacterium]